MALIPIHKKDERMLANMAVHYSQPKGFVGRSICYAIYCDGNYYGTMAGGSATRHLPNRKIVGSLNNGVNNIFFHIEKPSGGVSNAVVFGGSASGIPKDNRGRLEAKIWGRCALA